MNQEKTLARLVEALGAELVCARGGLAALTAHWTTVTTDSRAVRAGAVFVALPGERFDGHDFAANAARAGAAALVVEHPVEGAGDVPQLVVASSRRAFGRIARAWRLGFTIPVAAVGGSNGKTTVTQMTAAVLRARFGTEHVHATAGNFNNDVGVPQTLLGLSAVHSAAVVEAGMNHPGEMGALAGLIRPDLVILTNAQREHQEHLASVEETAWENGMLLAALPEGGGAVIPADDPGTRVWRTIAAARGARLLTWSMTEGVPADVEGERLPDGGLLVRFCGSERRVRLSIAGAHNARNALAVFTGALALGIDPDTALTALAHFRALAGRGERTTVESARGTFTLVDDAYNCNPDSALASVRMLAAEPAPRIFIFGDMAELGAKSDRWHAEVGRAAAAAGIERFWTTGAHAKHAAEAFEAAKPEGACGRWFSSRDELVAHLAELPLAGAVVVVKASHSSGFADVVKALKAL